MQFSVPKFIEYETKLIGPFTLKQALFLLIPGGIAFLIYLAIGKTNFLLFLVLAILLLGSGTALAFFKIEGRPLPTVLVNFIKYMTRPQRYFWQKEEKAILTLEVKKFVPKKTEEETLQIPETSRLKRAKIKIETQTR